jgi:hypothetical protein
MALYRHGHRVLGTLSVMGRRPSFILLLRLFPGREYSAACNPPPPRPLHDNGFALHGFETVSKIVDLGRMRGSCIALKHQFEAEHDLWGLALRQVTIDLLPE